MSQKTVSITFSAYFSLNSDFFVFSRFYWTLSETYRKSVNWTQLLVKFTEKSCCPNKYRTSCKFYWSFLCVHVCTRIPNFWPLQMNRRLHRAEFKSSSISWVFFPFKWRNFITALYLIFSIVDRQSQLKNLRECHRQSKSLNDLKFVWFTYIL